jgi:hypothetical protein
VPWRFSDAGPGARRWLGHRRRPRNLHNGRLLYRSKQRLYSITSSARAESMGGTSMPSAFAVFKFMTSSNLVVCTTGRLQEEYMLAKRWREDPRSGPTFYAAVRSRPQLSEASGKEAEEAKLRLSAPNAWCILIPLQAPHVPFPRSGLAIHRQVARPAAPRDRSPIPASNSTLS